MKRFGVAMEHGQYDRRHAVCDIKFPLEKATHLLG